ncbi:MAG TPA: PepSY domain-containing protein [Steroidobacteraceae bacterium]|nr:PepSY domain-containing protein [Candidatus Dormibacteraeota bacterium]HYM28639.1 PepSY domain-containing protein [Steroidobacteraceae bacterium]
MRLSYGSLLILCLSLCGATLPVPAAPAQAAMAQSSVSMDQAVKMVEQRFRARVVKAESQRDGARTVYVLRLLNDSGRVWTVRVDAASGAIS